jgi:hypothetical protein
LLVGTGRAAQSRFPALLAEQGAAEHHDELMMFCESAGSWQFNSVEYQTSDVRT